MARKREGAAEHRNGKWQAHLRLPGPAPRKRKWFVLDPQPRDRETAKAAALTMQTMLDARGYVPSERDTTVNEYSEHRWLPMQEKRWPSSWTNDRSNLRLYVHPEIGTLPMQGLTKQHGRDLVRKLDALAASGTISPKTASNIWYTATCVMADAVSSNEPTIAILDTNPFADIDPPKEGIKKEKQFLHPDEFLRLVACPAVPLVHARLYTFAAYTQLRQGEIYGLRWRDVDVQHGTIKIDHQLGSGDDGDAATKTRTTHRIKIEPALRPLLEAMQQEGRGKGSARVFSDPPPATGEYGLANMIRAHIELSGIEREELRVRTRTSRWIVFHDLRATGAVWRFKRNGAEDTITDVMEDGGWGGLGTVQKYLRLARYMTGTPFPALPARLLANPAFNGPAMAPRGHSDPRNLGNFVGAAGIEPATSTV
jgi:integrase